MESDKLSSVVSRLLHQKYQLRTGEKPHMQMLLAKAELCQQARSLLCAHRRTLHTIQLTYLGEVFFLWGEEEVANRARNLKADAKWLLHFKMVIKIFSS